MKVRPILFRAWLFAALCLMGVRGSAAQVANHPQVKSSEAGYRIAGTIVSSTDAHALDRARVTIRDAKDPQKFQSVVTGVDGRFEFSGLPAGKYALEGAKRGFISAAYDQHDQYSTAIVTGAGLEIEKLQLRLAPDAVIAGKVLDEFNEPVRRATATLYYDDHSGGIDRIRQSGSAQTDDQGTYEMTPLRPGTYFLSVTAKPWYAVHPNYASEDSEKGGQPAATSVDRSLDVAYPLTFYADVTDAESATPIPVRGGDHLQVDVHMNPVPALRLLFRNSENGRDGFSVPQLQQPAFDGTNYVQNSGVRQISPGLMEITGIPAGRYNISTGGSQSLLMSGVDLNRDGEEIDTSAAEAMSEVKVLVKIPAEPTLPSRLMVGLRSGRRASAAWQTIDAKGEAKFESFAPGRYEVVVQAFGKPYSIAHIAVEGAQVSGHTLTVAAGSSPSISLTLVGGDVDVQGTVKKAGVGFAGAMVVLVPKDADTDHALFRRDQSDLDGTFILHGVVPGPYTLLAIENGWDLDWSQPGVIAAYSGHGKKIAVSGQAGRAMNVGEAIEVQSK